MVLPYSANSDEHRHTLAHERNECSFGVSKVPPQAGHVRTVCCVRRTRQTSDKSRPHLIILHVVFVMFVAFAEYCSGVDPP
ncbi:hypothetical protein RRG08_059501 [Elysia crispata]|uniref:Uncharacterized protein n=1 Tax=Elysia crispata TaxID=231223 RepID=A0AAE1CV32_9GAST|nr:hypothetical protein RRG08_059501 [Elysia crispata]